MKNLLKLLTMAALTLFLWVGFFNIAQAAPKKKQTSNAKVTVTYVVKKGDSIDKIARKYDVKSDDIARWNNLSDIERIRAGQKLRIRVPKDSSAAFSDGGASKDKARTVVQNVSYIVKKGDSLGKIARKTGVSVETLKKNNASLRKNPDKLRVGQKLVLSVQKFDGATGVSRGLANNGSLVGGIQMKDGPGYFMRNPKYSYGTALTVGLLMDTFAAYHEKYPKGPRVAVADISAKNGGKLRPHLSHQSGRDVDFSYISKGKFEGFASMNAGNFDAEKNWFIAEYLLKTNKVQYIFCDYSIQKLLYDYARSAGYSEAELKPLIQYPNGRKSYSAIIRHAKGHANHFHVRFVCSPTDKDCK